MPTIPSHHVVGDAGHTTDHNAITDVLTDHETRVTSLQAVQPTYMVKTGGNVINLTNPSGVSESVVVPAGTRDTTVYVKQVTYGGKRTFGLDTYGQARLSSATVADVPLEVFGYSSSQTGDLQRWRQYQTGSVLSRVDSAGNIYAPNLTPSAWTNISLNAAVASNSPGTGAPPQWRIVGDEVQLRGTVKKANNTDFTTSPQDLGTLPPQAYPPYIVYALAPANFVNDEAYGRLEVTTTGVVRVLWRAGSGFSPAWFSLDGISFSRTA